MSKTSKWIVTVVVLALAGCVCISIICIAGAGLVLWQQNRVVSSSSSFDPSLPTAEPVLPPPTRAANPSSESDPTVTPIPAGVASSDAAAETLRTLSEEVVPVNDPLQMAGRFKGVYNIAPTVPAPAPPLKVGDQHQFWVTNSDTDEKRQAAATLRYINDGVYFWVENGLEFNMGDLRRLADTFANKIVPTDREFFGKEWNPGVDDDPRMHVLYVSNIGSSVAGYFSSADEVPPAAFEFSNAREMFVLSSDNVTLAEEYIYGVMAHEFQHMIHYATDRNEESWVNEGFSVLAELLNGYDIGGFDFLFMNDPDLALTYWPGPGESGPNYGASFLFLDYFLNRFGEKATQALVAHPENGMESVDLVLKDLGEKDPQTGKTLTADDFYADWAVANYLDDSSLADGRYDYKNYPAAPKASPTEEFDVCPVATQRRTVNQYGTDYIRFTCSGKHTLTFSGAPQVPLLPTDPYSGQYAFWSNKGDESDMTLSRTFDLSAVSGTAVLSYRTWYDVEKGYDYVYLLASTDGGKTWEMLHAPSGTDENPNGSNYGWGYNGESGPAWIKEEVDLSKFAGKQVQLRFEYVTDAAVNGQGFLIDDVTLDAVGYSTDFEKDDGGWVGDGFVRVANRLPQTFRATLILMGNQTSIIPLELDANQQGSLNFEIGKGVNEAILVVGGTTRFTNQKAQYEYEVK
jgi:immune inhibitor A